MKQLSPLDYAAHGLPMVPIFEIVKNDNGRLVCSCGRFDCKPGKHPVSDLAPHGLEDATTDATVIKEWMVKRPHSNWAMLTGAASGVVVLDVDPKHGGLQSMKDLMGSESPEDWGTNLIQKTGSDGYHLLFKHPGKPVRNKVGFMPGLDIRGDGGYIVVAPSGHISGGAYAWLHGNKWLNGSDVEVGESIPPQVIEALAQHQAAPVVPDEIPDGQRDQTLTRLAGVMRRAGFPPEAILDALRVVNRDKCKPPKEDHDVRRIANSSRSWAPEPTESSWLPKDISAWLAGDRTPLEPSFLIRSDGQALVYRGRVHSFIGEPETGKSWFAQILCGERLKAGDHAVYVDFEGELDDVGSHLLALGVSEDQLAAGFHYLRPEVRMSKDAIADLVEMVADWAPEALIIDGVERGLAMWGKDSNLNKDVIEWEERFVLPLRKVTPGATVLIDHVVKDKDRRGPYATGAQQKLAGIDGAQFSVELVPGTNNYFGKGKTGLARILLQKDSRGGGSLRGIQGARSVIAFMRLTSSADGQQVAYELSAPPPETPGAPDGTGEFRPTWYMEKVSKLLEGATEPLSLRGVQDAIGGKVSYVRKALADLVADGYVGVTEGSRGAHLHRSLKQYRDPASTVPADHKFGAEI